MLVFFGIDTAWQKQQLIERIVFLVRELNTFKDSAFYTPHSEHEMWTVRELGGILAQFFALTDLEVALLHGRTVMMWIQVGTA